MDLTPIFVQSGSTTLTKINFDLEEMAEMALLRKGCFVQQQQENNKRRLADLLAMLFSASWFYG
jgi:hypothetical protein